MVVLVYTVKQFFASDLFLRFSRDRKNHEFKLPQKCLLKMTQNLEINTEGKRQSMKSRVYIHISNTQSTDI